MISETVTEKHQRMTNKTASSDAAEAGSGLEALMRRASAQLPDGKQGRGLPPVELWEPDYCGELDMEIRADGTWFYMGTPIGRKELVRLFSTVLRKDADGETYLVTPVEKIKIRVEDAHFLAVEMDVSGTGDEQVLTFRTNVGDVVTVNEKNPLRFVVEEDNDGLKPYLAVRGRLEALVSRSVMYELAALGEDIVVDGQKMFAVRSAGSVFAMMPAEELQRQADGLAEHNS